MIGVINAVLMQETFKAPAVLLNYKLKSVSLTRGLHEPRIFLQVAYLDDTVMVREKMKVTAPAQSTILLSFLLNGNIVDSSSFHACMRTEIHSFRSWGPPSVGIAVARYLEHSKFPKMSTHHSASKHLRRCLKEPLARRKLSRKNFTISILRPRSKSNTPH